MKKRIALLILLAAALLLTACGIHKKLEKIDVEQAKSVAMNALGISGEELSYMAAELKERDGNPYYEVKLTVDSVDYVFAIDALSGVIIEQTPNALSGVIIEQTPNAETTPPEIAPQKIPTSTEDHIGEEKAFEIAHTDAGYTAAQAYMVSCELGESGGTWKYKIQFYGVSQGYTYEVDALTGEVLSRGAFSPRPQPRDDDGIDTEMNVYPLSPAARQASQDLPKPMNAELAKAEVLKCVPGATLAHITAFTTDTADGKMEYKGKIVYGGTQFDFTIDGYSGAIRAWTATPTA